MLKTLLPFDYLLIIAVIFYLIRRYYFYKLWNLCKKTNDAELLNLYFKPGFRKFYNRLTAVENLKDVTKIFFINRVNLYTYLLYLALVMGIVSALLF